MSNSIESISAAAGGWLYGDSREKIKEKKINTGRRRRRQLQQQRCKWIVEQASKQMKRYEKKCQLC